MSAGRRLRWVGYRRRYFGENCCNRSFAGVYSSAGVTAEARGGVHLGKIGLQCAIAALDSRDSFWQAGLAGT